MYRNTIHKWSQQSEEQPAAVTASPSSSPLLRCTHQHVARGAEIWISFNGKMKERTRHWVQCYFRLYLLLPLLLPLASFSMPLKSSYTAKNRCFDWWSTQQEWNNNKLFVHALHRSVLLYILVVFLQIFSVASFSSAFASQRFLFFFS